MVKFMVMNFDVSQGDRCGGFFGGKNSCRFSPSKSSLKICHQNFTTFFTMWFTISKEICHLVLTLGAMSCDISEGKWEFFVQTVSELVCTNYAFICVGGFFCVPKNTNFVFFEFLGVSEKVFRGVSFSRVGGHF